MNIKLFAADILFGCSFCLGTWARKHETFPLTRHIRGATRRQLRDADIGPNIALHDNNIFRTSNVTASLVDHQGAKIKEAKSTKSHDSEQHDDGDEQGGDEKGTSKSSKSSTSTSSSPEPSGQTTTKSKTSKVETKTSKSSTPTSSSTKPSKSTSTKSSKKSSTSTTSSTHPSTTTTPATTITLPTTITTTETCPAPPPVCQPTSLCFNSTSGFNSTSVCENSVWDCVYTPILCREGDVCDPTDGECKLPFSIVPTQVVQGEDAIITFRVIPEEPLNGSQIELYFNKSGVLIGQPLDDGSSSSGDAQANDGVFTNTFSFNFQEIGDIGFKASIGSVIYYSYVTVVNGSAVVKSSVANELEAKFQEVWANQSPLDAIQQVYEDFIADLPGNVQENKVILTTGIYLSLAWTTDEGLTEVIAPGLPFQNGQPNWETILFGDIIPAVTNPSASNRELASFPGHHNSRGVMGSLRRDEVIINSFDECLNGILGLEVSFHGMQSENLLWDYAKIKGIPSRISYYTSALNNVDAGEDPLSILKDLQNYQLISIVAPTRVVNYGSGQQTIALVTDVPFDGSSSQYAGEMTAKRVIVVNGYLAVTPEFFKRYTSGGSGGAVYIGGSESTKLLSGFSGFNAYFGHSSSWTPVDPWISLFNGNGAGDTPCVSDNGCFLQAGDPLWSLNDLCEDQLLPKLVVTYTWPLSQKDLDTGTEFLGEQVGFGCGGYSTDYMVQHTKDDTSAGGKENVTIDLKSALDNGEWSTQDGVIVNLRAGWYSYKTGTGPATVSVQFEDGSFNSGVQTISPGRQSGCASTCVGSVFVSLVPRLSSQVTIGQCDFIPYSPHGPSEKPGPNSCERAYYEGVDFDPFGPGEIVVALSSANNLYDIYQLHEIRNDASSTALAQFTNDPCHNNECDAFRHAYFSFQVTSWRKGLPSASNDDAVAWAKMWGDAHEISSVNSFPERIMDLINNNVGRRLAIENPTTNKANAVQFIMDAISHGRLILSPVTECDNIENHSYDVVVVGGGTGGVAAAIEAARNGSSVALLEETDWLGGQMSAAGVSGMDGGFANLESGFYAEFLETMEKYYSNEGHKINTCLWAYRSDKQPAADVKCFEPSIARRKLNDLTNAANVQVYTRTTITDVKSVFTDGRTRVVGVYAKERESNGSVKNHYFSANITIDATETGDVLEHGPAEFRLSKRNGTKETLNLRSEDCIQRITYVAVIKQYQGNFPYNQLHIQSEPPGYNDHVNTFRDIVTTDGTYWNNDTCGLYHNESCFGVYPMAWSSFINYRGMPDSKSEYNDPGPNNDTIYRTGINYYRNESSPGNDVIINADLSRQSKNDAGCKAKLRTIQFLYYIQNELGKSDWSVAVDEGYNTPFNTAQNGNGNDCSNIDGDLALIESHLPVMPYVREGRRLVGLHTLTAQDIKREEVCNSKYCKDIIFETYASTKTFSDALVIGDYGVDLHGCDQSGDLESNNEYNETRADVPVNSKGKEDAGIKGPFQVPFRSFIPKSVDGLLVAEKNLAVSRLANGAIREQPITMLTGQAAGAIASISLNKKVQPRYVPPLLVQRHLLGLNHKCRLGLRTFKDVDRLDPHWADVQLVSGRGIMIGSDVLNADGSSDRHFLGEQNLGRAEVAVAACRLFNVVPSEPSDNTYADLLPGHWAYQCVEALTERDIVKGCQAADENNPKPHFCPSNNITRAELATLLARAYDPNSYVHPIVFNYMDVPDDHWAFNFIQFVTAYGWMNNSEYITKYGDPEGCGANSFCPEASVPRFEAAWIIGNVLDTYAQHYLDEGVEVSSQMV